MLSSIALATKGNLGKLSIQIPDQSGTESMDETLATPFAVAIVKGAYELGDMMEELREVEFMIEFPITKVSGGSGGETNKIFTMTNNEDNIFMEDPKPWEPLECKSFIDEIVSFTGSGLRKLALYSESFVNVEDISQSRGQIITRLGAFKVLLQRVGEFKATLEDLKLDIQAYSVAELALKLVTQCPKLSSLELRIGTDKYRHRRKDISFPKDAFPSNLKNLSISMDCSCWTGSLFLS